MRILVTNDDGIKALGLKKLVEKVLKYGEVVVVAPKKEQSGKSHSMTIRKGIKCRRAKDILPGVRTHFVDSTPTDCVRFAMYYLKEEFDLLLSGVNNGFNLGEDIFYSGTVGAASEGALYGKQALALSVPKHDFADFEKNFDIVMEYIFNNRLLEQHYLYNINFTKGASKGIQITEQGKTNFEANLIKTRSGVFQKGKPNFSKEELKIHTDVGAIYNNYISITPLSINRTDFRVLKKLNKE